MITLLSTASPIPEGRKPSPPQASQGSPLAEWKVLATTFSITEWTASKKLCDPVRKLAANDGSPVVSQIMTLERDLAFLDAGPISLVLSSEAGRAAGDAEVVFGTEHVAATSRLLERAGIALLSKPHLVSGSSWAASFRDPDGHILSIFGPE